MPFLRRIKGDIDAPAGPGGGDASWPPGVEAVFRALERELVSGEIPFGNELAESQLIRRFAARGEPIQPVLRRLQDLGLVEQSGAGVRMAAPTSADVGELYAIRASLEAQACRLATASMSEAAFDALEAMLPPRGSEREGKSSPVYDQSFGPSDFHYAIGQGCGSCRLERLLCRDLYPVFRLLRCKAGLPADRVAQALEEHQRILDAMRARDGELAAMLMRRHVVQGGERLQAQMAGECRGGIG